MKNHKQNNYCFIKLCDYFQASLMIPGGLTPDFELGLTIYWVPFTKSCRSEIKSLTHKDIFLNMISDWKWRDMCGVWGNRRENKFLSFLILPYTHTHKNHQVGQQPNEVWVSVGLVSSENRLKNQKSAIFIEANRDFIRNSNFCQIACCHIPKTVLPTD